jgi:hypothetical protein
MYNERLRCRYLVDNNDQLRAGHTRIQTHNTSIVLTFVSKSLNSSVDAKVHPAAACTPGAIAQHADTVRPSHAVGVIAVSARPNAIKSQAAVAVTTRDSLDSSHVVDTILSPFTLQSTNSSNVNKLLFNKAIMLLNDVDD